MTPRAFFQRIAIAGLLCFSMTSCQTTKNKEESVFRMRNGTALLQQGHYPEALRELLHAEKLDPQNAAIQNNLGLAYFLRDKYDMAGKHLVRAIDLKPDYSEARNNYARVLIEQGKYAQAINELEKVIKDLTYTEPSRAWVNMGLARFRQKNYSGAKKNFADAIKLNREDCLAHTLYGRSLFEMGDFVQAAPALDNAVVVCRISKFDEPHYFSGLTYYKLGRTSDAVSRMEEVINLYPGSRYAKKAESLLQIMR
ncbi:MAG: tetratricopeptide repeat protein [Bdellovibrionota bacterium]